MWRKTPTSTSVRFAADPHAAKHKTNNANGTPNPAYTSRAFCARGTSTAAWAGTSDSPAIPDAPPGNERRRLEVRRPHITIRSVLVGEGRYSGQEIGANGRASRVRALTSGE